MSRIERWLAAYPRSRISLAPADFAVLAALAIGAALCCWSLGSMLAPLARADFNDFWYGADSYRVFANLTDRTSNHYRSSIHPLFPLLVASPVIVATQWLHFEPFTTVLFANSVNAALVVGLLYAVLRSFRPLLDATIYSLLFLSSAAFIFWFGVPETFPWGATSILLALLVIAMTPFGRGWVAIVLVSAATLSITVTNWMVGLLAAFLTQPVRRAVHASVYAFALVALLTAVQYIVFPTAGKFLYVRQEHRYVARDPVEAAVGKLDNFWVSPLVARPPQVRALSTPVANHGVLRSVFEPRTPLGSAAAVGWLAMLAVGAWALLADAKQRVLKVAVVAAILGQWLLHIVYGSEPFLYSAHYGPLLIVAAAFGSATKARWLALSLAVAVSCIGAYSNLEQFHRSVRLMRDPASYRCAAPPGCDSGSELSGNGALGEDR